jgi:hypothetical protein
MVEIGPIISDDLGENPSSLRGARSSFAAGRRYAAVLR